MIPITQVVDPCSHDAHFAGQEASQALRRWLEERQATWSRARKKLKNWVGLRVDEKHGGWLDIYGYLNRAGLVQGSHVSDMQPDLHAGRGTCFFSDGQFFQGDWTEAPIFSLFFWMNSETSRCSPLNWRLELNTRRDLVHYTNASKPIIGLSYLHHPFAPSLCKCVRLMNCLKVLVSWRRVWNYSCFSHQLSSILGLDHFGHRERCMVKACFDIAMVTWMKIWLFQTSPSS